MSRTPPAHFTYSARIKTNRQILDEIPSKLWGWWKDVAAGRVLEELRDATAADLARCHLHAEASRDPRDYLCEGGERGSLIPRIAIQWLRMELPTSHTQAETAAPAAASPIYKMGDDAVHELYEQAERQARSELPQSDRDFKVALARSLIALVMGTPASAWAVDGEPDPHGDQYRGERGRLCMGHMTDDQLANAMFLCDHRTSLQSIGYLTAGKERIRWLSRALTTAAHERGLLASAIRDAAVKAGIARADAELTGPHLLMLANDLADCASKLSSLRDLLPEEPNDAMQAAGAQAIRFDTTIINKIWTANAVWRAMRAVLVPAGE